VWCRLGGVGVWLAGDCVGVGVGGCLGQNFRRWLDFGLLGGAGGCWRWFGVSGGVVIISFFDGGF